VAVPACLAAGWFEYTRAVGGNALSWAYVIEWPMIAGIGCYMWWRLVREERAEIDAVPGRGDDRAAAATSSPQVTGEPVDPEQEAWDLYLAGLHASDPPGGPPWERPDAAG
jgi:hypothetical protein